MSIISVEGKSLGAELAVWGVPHNYAVAFAEKSASKNGRIALHPFFFNDTEHMTNQRHWLAIMLLSGAACTAKLRAKRHRLKRWRGFVRFSIQPGRWVLAR